MCVCACARIIPQNDSVFCDAEPGFAVVVGACVPKINLDSLQAFPTIVMALIFCLSCRKSGMTLSVFKSAELSAAPFFLSPALKPLSAAIKPVASDLRDGHAVFLGVWHLHFHVLAL